MTETKQHKVRRGGATNNRCSFCGKSDQTGKLISSPSLDATAYICDECVAVCHQIIHDKPDPFDGNPLLEALLTAAESWIAAESRGTDASVQLSELRRVASLVFEPGHPH